MSDKAKSVLRVDQRLLTIKLSYNENTNRFFIDFWDIQEFESGQGKCFISMNISRAEAEGISRETGIKILM